MHTVLRPTIVDKYGSACLKEVDQKWVLEQRPTKELKLNILHLLILPKKWQLNLVVKGLANVYSAAFAPLHVRWLPSLRNIVLVS
jgi:hypothetical protein